MTNTESEIILRGDTLKEVGQLLCCQIPLLRWQHLYYSLRRGVIGLFQSGLICCNSPVWSTRRFLHYGDEKLV